MKLRLFFNLVVRGLVSLILKDSLDIRKDSIFMKLGFLNLVFRILLSLFDSMLNNYTGIVFK